LRLGDENRQYVVEHKVDGVSVLLMYEEARLALGALPTAVGPECRPLVADPRSTLQEEIEYVCGEPMVSANYFSHGCSDAQGY
jgi:hypothetical protein